MNMPNLTWTHETKSVEQVLSRMLDKVVPVTESGCWIWMGADKGDEEYGRVYIGSHRYQAHRLLYEILKCQVPRGLVLDHLCRVRCCVNPDHLEIVTHRENILRGKAPGILRMNAVTCAHGHPWTVENSRIHNGGRYCRTCDKLKNRRRRAERRDGLFSEFAGPIPQPEEPR